MPITALQAQGLVIRAAQSHHAKRVEDLSMGIFLALLKKDLELTNTNDIDKGKAVLLMQQAMELAEGAVNMLTRCGKSLGELRALDSTTKLEQHFLTEVENDEKTVTVNTTMALIEEHGVDLVVGKFEESGRRTPVRAEDFKPKPQTDEQFRDAAAHIEEQSSVVQPSKKQPENEGGQGGADGSPGGASGDEAGGAVDRN